VTVLKAALLGPDEYDEAELSRAARIDADVARRLWRAMGFVAPPPDARTFTAADLEALKGVRVALRRRPEDVVVQHTRALSGAMARVADIISEGAAEDLERLRAENGSDVEVAATAAAEIDRFHITRLLDYLFRRQLVTSLTRQLTSAGDGAESAALTVMFADLVGYTALTQELDDAELAALVTRFFASSYELVSAAGGRVVKTLGDEVMVTFEDPVSAAASALRLVDMHAADDALPEVRVGVASGPVLALQGDFFGPTVNLASRLTGIARPSSVLIADETRVALEESGMPVSCARLRPRRVKGIGWVSPWRLKARSAPALDQQLSSEAESG
jgi:adenylate cyclase